MRWEFKTYRWNSANDVTDKYEELEKDLNELGKIGWEVIVSVPTVFSRDEGVTEAGEVVYILKRGVK